MISRQSKYTNGIYNSITPNVTLYVWVMFVCLTGLMIFSSCKENASIATQGLNGKWEIYKADRNGRETPYLRRGYFIFDAQGILTVNITGNDESSPYTIDDNVITTEGKSTYTIIALRNESMDIHYAMNSENEFMFFLKKTSNEIH
jgi:hypothetical protein